jgi:hypothetical protein
LSAIAEASSKSRTMRLPFVVQAGEGLGVVLGPRDEIARQVASCAGSVDLSDVDRRREPVRGDRQPVPLRELGDVFV